MERTDGMNERKIIDIIEDNIPMLEKDMLLDWKGRSGFWTE